MIMKIRIMLTAACLALMPQAFAADGDCARDEYPTAVVTDYVLACMAANGNNLTSLYQCSCSIDFIKARMPFADFEQARTVMQIQLDRGQRGIFYRDSNWAKQRVENFQKIQAESTLSCF